MDLPNTPEACREVLSRLRREVTSSPGRRMWEMRLEAKIDSLRGRPARYDAADPASRREYDRAQGRSEPTKPLTAWLRDQS